MIPSTNVTLISTALVLFMTIPGLSAFYGGIVKRKNMLSSVSGRSGALDAP